GERRAGTARRRLPDESASSSQAQRPRQSRLILSVATEWHYAICGWPSARTLTGIALWRGIPDTGSKLRSVLTKRLVLWRSVVSSPPGRPPRACAIEITPRGTAVGGGGPAGQAAARVRHRDHARRHVARRGGHGIDEGMVGFDTNQAAGVDAQALQVEGMHERGARRRALAQPRQVIRRTG